eukprot:GAHX01001367.1.p1 GENE.GAHX01001367.1~~GAHX01001367.1.p1  ORF type:complete len:465 (+),score=79.30 GAHX01001367.1:46-1395(+)
MAKRRYSSEDGSAEGKLSTFATTVNLIKLIFGFGTFVLPYLTYLCGWLLASIFFIFGSGLMIWSALILGQCEDTHREHKQDRTTKFTFTKLTGAILGKYGMIPMQLTLFFTILFIVAFYLSAVGTMLSGNYKMEFKGSNVVYIILVAFSAFGLSFIQNQKLFSFANMFGIFAVFLSIVLSIAAGATKVTRLSDLKDQSVKDMFVGKGSLKAVKFEFANINKLLSGVVFLLCLGLCAVEFRQQIVNPKQNFKTAVFIAIVISSILNLIYAIIMASLLKDSFMLKEAIDLDDKGGKLNNDAIRKESGDLIVVNHLSNTKYVMKMIITFALTLNLLFSIMVISRVPVAIAQELTGSLLDKLDDKVKKMTLIGVKFGFIAMASILAITVKKIDVFCDIIGAVCFPILAFNFPGFFYFKVKEYDMTTYDWVVFIVLQMLGFYFVVIGIWLSLFA